MGKLHTFEVGKSYRTPHWLEEYNRVARMKVLKRTAKSLIVYAEVFLGLGFFGETKRIPLSKVYNCCGNESVRLNFFGNRNPRRVYVISADEENDLD